jgi:uncharacterized damage-inducible protein DinB
MSQLAVRPASSEFAPYYQTYVGKVPDGNILDTLRVQGTDVLALLRGIDESRSQHRYAEGKWSLREVLSHINDAERLFVNRAVWFARGLATPLPGFDQDVVMATAEADARSWKSHVDEFEAIRAATVSLFANLPDAAWSRTGTASDNLVSVRAIAWITAGHVNHHVGLIRERYL